ncbi:Bacterial alpha-L-rhamnosidase [Cohnella sp. CFH 77786]|uniref:alpha-L-rhamnosidase-related protein n=1 Tax=Cohnella sp. CFH 77786 TaxID=2662265 RepID=UPI001C60DB1B|nr:alpha-L-rhamnosidase C-terminal domain-containing protein [Cohnella sp. CFH 77786]MBW5448553.1 Bacterial alpha-L-rhamnosidase [Cohnella sp. CFH 77786]
MVKEMKAEELVRSPQLKGYPKSQEIVRFRLRFALADGWKGGERGCPVRIAADAQYVLWVNGRLVGQGPHRNFPDTLMADEYEAGAYLRAGENVIAVLVRHLYLDTFGYLRGEPAFGFWGTAGGTDLTTGRAAWECRSETRYEEFAPRVNMHLGPSEEQDGDAEESWVSRAAEDTEVGAEEGAGWIRPVSCADRARKVLSCPVAPLVRNTRDLSRDAELAGTFAALPAIGGTLYAYTPDVDVKNKAIAVRLRIEDEGDSEIKEAVRLCIEDEGDSEIAEEGAVRLRAGDGGNPAAAEAGAVRTIGYRGLGACLIREEGSVTADHAYGHHAAEGRFEVGVAELARGVLLYLLDAEYLFVGEGSGEPSLEVLGYHPMRDSFLQFDSFADAPPGLDALLPCGQAVQLVPVKKTRLFGWDRMRVKPAEKTNLPGRDRIRMQAGDGGEIPALLPGLDRIHMQAGDGGEVPALLPGLDRIHMQAGDGGEIPALLPGLDRIRMQAGDGGEIPALDLDRGGLRLSGEGAVLRLHRFSFGHLELDFEAEGGPGSDNLVEIGYGYDTDADDLPFVFNWDRFRWTGGSASFRNRFTPRGFRYLFLSTHSDVTLKGIRITEALAAEPIAERLGFVRTDDPLWNRIWATARETLRYSRTDVIASDSFREFCAWLGDSQHIALNYYYTFFDPAFIRYTWDLYGRNADGEGRMFSVVPGYMKFHLPVWTWQYWLGVRNHYFYTGDRAFLESAWPVCTATYAFFERFKTDEGLLRDPEGWAIVDWARIDFGGESFVLNGLYRRAALALAELAEARGDAEGAARFSASAERVRGGLAHSRFFDAAKNLFHDGIRDGKPVDTFSQHAQLLAFDMGLWEEDELGGVWERVNDPELEIWTIGEPSYHWAADILRASRDLGRFLADIRAAYAWRAEQGVACFGHTHPGNRPGRSAGKQRSPAHGWASCPVYLSGAYLLGVRPLEPGYAAVEIAPRPLLGGMREMEGQVPTPHGPVHVQWRLEADGSGTLAGMVPTGMPGIVSMSGFGSDARVERAAGAEAVGDGSFRLTGGREFEIRFRKNHPA